MDEPINQSASMPASPSVSHAGGKFSPKASFFMGLGAGFFVICTIGFFVLLGVLLTDKNDTPSSAQANVATPPVVAPSADKQAPTEPTAPISIKGLQKDDHVYGDVNAPITLVVFSDTECPFCKRFHPTMKQVVDNYKGKVNLVYRHFPLAQLHSKAPKEAEATECAAELGGNAGFWKYLDRMMEITPSNDGLDAAKLPEIAKEVGLDQKKFEECYASGRHASKVQAQYNEGLAAGAQGTPYGVILAGDQKIPVPGAVPLEQIKATIDPLIQ